jgi:lysophospholipase L1-like esterase
MKSVLCYGDSNTWGAATVHRPDGRYPTYERWPGVLRNTLGPHWLVIEEGLGGRTTVRDDPVEGADKNGLTYLTPCLRSHRPLDVVAIMLGTNDLKARFNISAWEVAEGAGLLVSTVLKAECGRNGGAPEVLLIAPPPFRPELPSHADMFAGAYEKSREFARRYKAVAERLKVRFFDAGSVIASSKVDGFHLDPEAHDVLGRAVAAEINKIPIKAS